MEFVKIVTYKGTCEDLNNYLYKNEEYSLYKDDRGYLLSLTNGDLVLSETELSHFITTYDLVPNLLENKVEFQSKSSYKGEYFYTITLSNGKDYVLVSKSPIKVHDNDEWSNY